MDLIERAKAALKDITEGPWTAVHVGNVHWGVSSDGYDFPTRPSATSTHGMSVMDLPPSRWPWRTN